MKLPWFKFFPSDWLADTRLAMCSAATRGIWINAIARMCESDMAAITGSPDQLARILNCTVSEVHTAIDELQRFGAANVRNCNGVVTVESRRLARECKARKDNALRVRRFREKEGVTQDVMKKKQHGNREMSEVRCQNKENIENKTDLIAAEKPPLEIASKPAGGFPAAEGKRPGDEFERFWQAYPRKIGKGAAIKAWQKASGRPGIERIIAAIERQKQTRQWRESGGQFIPHPTTWLNQQRWSDEVQSDRAEHDGGFFDDEATTCRADQEVSHAGF